MNAAVALAFPESAIPAGPIRAAGLRAPQRFPRCHRPDGPGREGSADGEARRHPTAVDARSGKGRNGGKWRTIPVTPVAHAELLPFVMGHRVADRIYPWHYGTSYGDVRSAGLAAGIPIVSMHDLRRSFGRHAFYPGMDLVQLRNLYGHTSVDMTAPYIGLDDLEM